MENDQCTGKFPFPDKPSANVVAKSSARSKEQRMNVYKCTHCNMWHVGGSGGSKVKSDRRALLEFVRELEAQDINYRGRLV